jgi:hypothetical protein
MGNLKLCRRYNLRPAGTSLVIVFLGLTEAKEFLLVPVVDRNVEW